LAGQYRNYVGSVRNLSRDVEANILGKVRPPKDTGDGELVNQAAKKKLQKELNAKVKSSFKSGIVSLQ
jgi:hypothetical protein